MNKVIETISGKLVRGKGVGRMLGFPTLNIPYEGDKRGIFVGKVIMNNEQWKAAVHIGKRLTFGGDGIICEAYLLDFDMDVEMGSEVEVQLLEKIRESVKFDDLDLLKEQISKDVEFVKNWYNSK